MRRYWITSDIAWIEVGTAWKGLQSIGMVERTRKIGNKTETQTHYYLVSFKANAKEFARAARGHWSIENSMHWTLDVTFREDEARTRKDYGAQNLATLRKIALNLLKSEKTKKTSLRSKRLLAALDTNFLEILFFRKNLGLSKS